MELPEVRMPLPSYWVYMIKRNGAGNVKRFKARLVFVGNPQIEGINYQPMDAPTALVGHGRLALPIAANYDLEIAEMDVCPDFLGVEMGEVIYMHLPQG